MIMAPCKALLMNFNRKSHYEQVESSFKIFFFRKVTVQLRENLNIFGYEAAFYLDISLFLKNLHKHWYYDVMIIDKKFYDIN